LARSSRPSSSESSASSRSRCGSTSSPEHGQELTTHAQPRQRLQERAWFSVTETLLALTIFRDDFDSSFIVLFVSLLFLKVFHWLAADRVEAVRRHLYLVNDPAVLTH